MKWHKWFNRLILISIIGVSIWAFLNPKPADAWWNATWTYRTPITINGSMVSNVSNFPILIVDINQSCGDFWNHVNANGSDIVVTNADGSIKYERELVSIDAPNQTMELWVNISDGLTSGINKTIFLYYGNPTGAEINSTVTWDTDYTTVYHMNDNPDNAHVRDSTAGNHQGTKSAPNLPTEIQGVIGRAQRFNRGIGTYIVDVEAIDYDYGTNNFTVEWYVRWNDTAVPYMYMWALQAGEASATCQMGAAIAGAGNGVGAVNGQVYLWDGIAVQLTGVQLISGQWTHLTVTRTGTGANQVLVYQNGTLNSTVTSAKNINPSKLYIGMLGLTHTHCLHGDIDEIRFSSAERAGEWVSTNYNLTSPYFYATGNESLEPYICPTYLNLTGLGGSDVVLNWTPLGGYYMVRSDVDQYPENITDGRQVYVGTNNWTIDHGLSLQVQSYYYRVWSSYCGNASICYAENKIGGSMIQFGVFAFIALGITVLAFWQKRVWIFFLASMAWVGIGAYCMTGYAWGDVMFHFGWLGFVAGLIMIFAWIGYRKKEPYVSPTDPGMEYGNELEASRKRIRARQRGYE